MNILVVDDEKEITDLIQIYLENENFTVYKYYSSPVSYTHLTLPTIA